MLDVGCGVGSFHPLLRGMVGRLSGIDVPRPASRKRAPSTATSTIVCEIVRQSE
jgi:predicted TPR repeat methyltransferase